MMGKSEMLLKASQDLKTQASDGIQAEAIRYDDASPIFEPWSPEAFELYCARTFNIELPLSVPEAIAKVEKLIQEVFQVDSSLILTFDETSCVYLALNDLKYPEKRPRELTLIDDHFLQDWLQCQTVFQLPVILQAQSSDFVGILALGRKSKAKHFNSREEWQLDLAMPYVARLIQSLQTLIQSASLPYTQSVVLEVSNRLISAVDQETILVSVLESLQNRLNIDGCQYVCLKNTPQHDILHSKDEGEVLFESVRGVAKNHTLKNYTKPHRKHGKKAIPRLMSLLNLFQSSARKMPYLLLNHQMLGDYPLCDWFGVESVQAALVLPIMDVTTQKPIGLLNLFNLQSNYIGPDTLEIGTQISVLVSLAMGRVKQIEQALVLATNDELTGLTNRRGFYERFEMEIERARRNPSSMCVALIDVDHFKQLNDTRGHLSGDLVLQHLAELLNNNVRKSDMVCRFGGEEFVLLLPDTGEKAAFDLLERMRRKIAKAKMADAQGEPVKITISAGLTVVNTNDYVSQPRQIIDEAIEEADKQLYKAKEISRNRVCSTRIDPGVVQCELPFLKRH
jgi:diguanylate cyclase (GGDEF)-like protein